MYSFQKKWRREKTIKIFSLSLRFIYIVLCILKDLSFSILFGPGIILSILNYLTSEIMFWSMHSMCTVFQISCQKTENLFKVNFFRLIFFFYFLFFQFAIFHTSFFFILRAYSIFKPDNCLTLATSSVSDSSLFPSYLFFIPSLQKIMCRHRTLF